MLTLLTVVSVQNAKNRFCNLLSFKKPCFGYFDFQTELSCLFSELEEILLLDLLIVFKEKLKLDKMSISWETLYRTWY